MSEDQSYLAPPPWQRPGNRWRSLSRLCFLGALVMLGWLLYPTARCSVEASKDIQLVDPGEPQDEELPDVGEEAGGSDGEEINDEGMDSSDEQRVAKTRGFFDRWASALKACYARTPINGQEDWKEWLLIGFAAAMVIFWIAARLADGPDSFT